MNRISLGAGALAALSVAAFALPVGAQVTLDAQASPMVTGALFLTDPPQRFAILRQAAAPLVVERGSFRNTIGVGASVGVRIAGNLGVDGVFWWVPTELAAGAGLEGYDGEVKLNSMIYGINFAYYFPRIGPVEPFVGIGAGGETRMYDPELAWQRQTDFSSNAVVGTHVWLNERVAVRAEARDVLTRFHSNIQGVGATNEHDLMLSAGVTYRTGLGR